MGRCSGNLTLKPLAAIVTYVGRSLINQTKEYFENSFVNDIRHLLKHKVKCVKLEELTKDECTNLLEKFISN